MLKNTAGSLMVSLLNRKCRYGCRYVSGSSCLFLQTSCVARFLHYHSTFSEIRTNISSGAYSWDNKLINTSNFPTRLRFTDVSHLAPPKWPAASNGNFDKLPLEIIQMILAETDLATIMHLRLTNSYLKAVIESWSPFRNILYHAPNVLGALLGTKTANIYTAPQVVDTIFTDRCEFCGDCGTFLQLLKLKRCCLKCLANDPRLLSIPATYAISVMGARTEDVARMHHLVTIPRDNFWGEKKHLGSSVAVDYVSALKMCNSTTLATPTILRKRLGLALNLCKCGLSTCKAAVDAAFKSKTVPPSYHMPKLDLSPSVHAANNNRYRFLAAIHAPIIHPARRNNFDKISNIPLSSEHSGGYCRGCRYYWNLLSPHHPLEHRVYTASEMKRHLESCFYARCWWNKLYPIGYPVDHARTRIVLSRQPVLPRNASMQRSASGFDVIDSTLLLLLDVQHGKHSPPTSQNSLLGPEAESQATWACARIHNTGILRRYLDVFLEKKKRQIRKMPVTRYKIESTATQMSDWKAATVFHNQPSYYDSRCINGLPMRATISYRNTVEWEDRGQEPIRRIKEMGYWCSLGGDGAFGALSKAQWGRRWYHSLERDNTTYLVEYFLDEFSRGQ